MAASVLYVLSQVQRWTSSQSGEPTDAVLLKRFCKRREEAAFAALGARHRRGETMLVREAPLR